MIFGVHWGEIVDVPTYFLKSDRTKEPFFSDLAFSECLTHRLILKES